MKLPIGDTPRTRLVNLAEVESFSTVGDVTTIYLKSGRKIENVLHTSAAIENKIHNAQGDALRLVGKYTTR